jgi:NADH dehydrogenase
MAGGDGERAGVVVVGAGFGGLACARRLGAAGVSVTIVDRRNYHLFSPLLYQVATAALNPADIARPIRRILSRHRSVRVLLAEAVGVDVAGRRLLLSHDRSLPYDRLVLATGSQYSYFGHDEWAPLAPGLKTLEDARAVRARLLTCFEQAEMATDAAVQAALMTTVVVGGGPTGVEVAGSIAELARHALARDFRNIDPRRARIILAEAGPRLLTAFPETLAAYAGRKLEALGVEVRTRCLVESIEEAGVRLAGAFVPAGTVVWAAGVKASPPGAWLGLAGDRQGRIPVAADLSVPDVPGVFAIGDLALCPGEDGQPLPGLAQVASQQGAHLGRALARNLQGGRPLPAFRFHNRGNAAIVGRSAAVFDFGSWRLSGWLAWVLWALVHVWLLVGFDKRLLVSLQWLWAYLTYQRGARLITRDVAVRPGSPPP